MTPTKTDLSKAGTITVCELYIQGELERIPENHIFVMLKTLTYQMKRNSFLGAEDPAIRAYVKVCMSDMETTARRYIQMTRSKQTSNLKWYLKTRYTRRDQRGLNERRHIIRANTLTDEYYEDVAEYKVGTVSYEGHELEIYYNIPVKNKHRTLTCFHTNPITMNQYFFKNLHDVLPSDELREQFELQLQPYWSRAPSTSVDAARLCRAPSTSVDAARLGRAPYENVD
jgi:hypothetical protein